jgi:acyl transferase domain-containing protein
MIGHLVGAAGIASALAALGAIRDGVIPPTANLHTPDPECDLDYVPLEARNVPVRTVAVNGFGFGGQNAVAIFRALENSRRRRRTDSRRAVDARGSGSPSAVSASAAGRPAQLLHDRRVEPADGGQPLLEVRYGHPADECAVPASVPAGRRRPFRAYP